MHNYFLDSDEETLFWTSIYDENGELLSEPITRNVNDLTSQHIVNIQLYCKRNDKILPLAYICKFKELLLSRGDIDLYKEMITHLSRM